MTNRFRILPFVALLITVGAAIPAHAQETTGSRFDFATGARPLGMSGTYNAVGTGAAGLYHNPAGIAAANMYSLNGTYEFTPSTNVLSASIVDSKTNSNIAAGVGYSYLLGRSELSNSFGHDIRLALAIPAVPDRVSVGVEGRYAILNTDGTELARGFTMEAGFLFRIVDKLKLGVVGRNLIDICDRPRVCRTVTPLTMAGGLAYGEGSPFTATADVEVDLGSEEDQVNLRYQIGGEYLVAGSVPIRVGYEHKTFTETDHVSLGAGWRASRFGIDIAGQMEIQDPEALRISSSFAVYFK
ncbi:MAG: hypothetical protein ABEL76_00425 [Bradymonadaceae bacterium]